MKKLMIVTLLFFLSSCTVSDPEEPIVIPDDKGTPILVGVEDAAIDYAHPFDPLEGVTASDSYDGDLTDYITIENEVDIYIPGIYLLKYRVSDTDGNETMKLRYVEVLSQPVDPSSNLIFNGSFNLELDGYSMYNVENDGHATFTVLDGVLEVEILSVEEGTWYRPRLNTEGITIENGHNYRVVFEAKADDTRMIQLQFGELLDHDPWFLKFDHDVFAFELTNSWQEFSYEFYMSESTNSNGSILFEFGDVFGDKTLTTVYIDNIQVYRID